MKKQLLLASLCLFFTLSIAHAQKLVYPQLVLYTDVTIMTTSYVMFEGDTGFVNFPCHFWTEEYTDTTASVVDTSVHFYYDKNDQNTQYSHTLTAGFSWLSPQTWYFYRQHAVDTNGNHYYSQFNAMKTAGIAAGVSDVQAQKPIAVMEGKQLHLQSGTEYRGGTMKVYSVLGSLIAEQTIENETTTVNLAGQPAGIYTISIEPIDRFTKRQVMKVISP